MHRGYVCCGQATSCRDSPRILLFLSSAIKGKRSVYNSYVSCHPAVPNYGSRCCVANLLYSTALPRIHRVAAAPDDLKFWLNCEAGIFIEK